MIDFATRGFLARIGSIRLAAGLAVGIAAAAAPAQDGAPPPEFKPWAEISKGYEKVATEGEPFYGLWVDKKKNQVLAELPRGFEGQKHFIALTVSSGEDYAGLQAGDILVYWKRQDNKLILMEPNIATQSTGDRESKDSVKRLFTDRVILDVPIVGMGANGQPVIDLDGLLAGRAATFFGKSGNASLATISKVKAFPGNIEVAFEMPTGAGNLQQFHYSVSQLGGTPGFKPREADERVGYFTTVYRDLGKFTDAEKWVRYVNRWNLEKRDSRLKLSPPKQPIVYYIENTVPVRYRRYVEAGILEWNKAFEKVGILNAIEVRQQDAETNTYMDKDAEDVRWNFVRWLANDQGTAIGPSRVNPYTGEILDADIILTDGWIRHFWTNFTNTMPKLAMEGMAPEAVAWLDQNPQWDPRVRMAAPEDRERILAERSLKGVTAFGGSPAIPGGSEYTGSLKKANPFNGFCMAADGKAFDVAMVRMYLDSMGLDSNDSMTGTVEFGTGTGADSSKADMLDGIPEWFIGPLLADLVVHEVGHTLGLRHNFKASSIYPYAQINSADVKDKKPFAGSVMDYIPINFNLPDPAAQAPSPTEEPKKEADSKDGEKKDADKKDAPKAPPMKPQDKGNYGMISVGPYDMWAIEYGYTFGDTKEVLKRVAEPDLVYGTDEDTAGPDPTIQRYDFAGDPLEYCKNQIDLAKWHRARLLDKFVKDGESWSKARRGYEMTLGLQTRTLGMMSRWIGGAYVYRDRKGDPNARSPVTPVQAAKQREALAYILETAFRDESFGITPQLLEKMTIDKWYDAGGQNEVMQENTWPIHDRIAGVQAAALSMVMNPAVLRRVFDNEFRVSTDLDTLTLPELMDSVSSTIWTELDQSGSGSYTPRKPMVSSLRRNLQREHVDRLIDLSLKGLGNGAASKPVSTLATAQLRTLKTKLDKFKNSTLDPYTRSHIDDARTRIEKALEAQYVYNAAAGGGGSPFSPFGNQPQSPAGFVKPVEPDQVSR